MNDRAGFAPGADSTVAQSLGEANLLAFPVDGALKLRRDAVHPPPAPAHPAPVAAKAPDSVSPWHAHVALADEFARVLRREQLRAARSQSPLSMAVYRIDDGADAARLELVDDLISLLRGNARETDVIGYAGAGLVAVLFPDTTEQGARRFVDKIARRHELGGVHTHVVTYPDCLFEDLAAPAQRPGSAPLFALPVRSDAPKEYRLKRVIDVFGALVALVVFAPIMLLTAMAIALTSPGPIIFKQRRLGKGGVPFVFYKFRSMSIDGDDSIHRKFVSELIKAGGDQSGVGDGGTFKIKADPRVSKVGRIIRKTSIDELPQLFNVLRGEMSLVGPRPALPYEAENYKPWHFRRVLEVRPGITGLWQVEGRSRVPFDEMVRMDLRYARECSLALDLRILFKTVKVVLKCDGAS